MNKSKLLVMAFTFVILIAITPFVFSKLMNSKFNQMLDKYRSEGYKIELIEDKSSYVTTDKVFNVVIPGDKIEGIKKADLLVEVKFNNLPVTDVKFIWIGKSIEFPNKEVLDLDGKLKGVVITPNFKNYSFKVEDIYSQDNNAIVKVKGLKGTYNSLENRVEVNVKQVLLKDKFNFITEFKNIVLKMEDNKKSSLKMDISVQDRGLNYQIQNLYLSSALFEDKFLSGAFEGSFDRFVVSNIVEFNKFKLNIKVDDINASLKEITQLDRYKDKVITTILKSGFRGEMFLNLDSVNNLVDGKKVRGFKGEVYVNILPVEDLERLEKYIKAKLYFDISKGFMSLLRNINPSIAAQILVLAKEEKKRYIIKLKFDKGKLLVNE